jgi:hypothetical protein
MRFLWLIISLLLLALMSIGVAQKAAELRTVPRLPKNPTPFEWLRAGYKEIPAGPANCSGTVSGTIHIRLANVLGDLHGGRTIFRNMTFEPGNNSAFPPGVPPRVLRADINKIKGFPTNLDFKTTVEGNGARQIVVDATHHVIIRVTLDKGPASANERVDFLHQTAPANAPPAQRDAIERDSRFAILQAYGVDRPIFVCRKPIQLDADKNPYVDFVVRSVGIPYAGSFGIGLLVRDPSEPHVTPIIIDPQVENEG